MAKHRKSYRFSDEDIKNLDTLVRHWEEQGRQAGALADPTETAVISEALRHRVRCLEAAAEKSRKKSGVPS